MKPMSFAGSLRYGKFSRWGRPGARSLAGWAIASAAFADGPEHSGLFALHRYSYLATAAWQIGLLRSLGAWAWAANGRWAWHWSSNAGPSACEPLLSGGIGVAGNVGYLTILLAVMQLLVTLDHWRWITLVSRYRASWPLRPDVHPRIEGAGSKPCAAPARDRFAKSSPRG